MAFSSDSRAAATSGFALLFMSDSARTTHSQASRLSGGFRFVRMPSAGMELRLDRRHDFSVISSCTAKMSARSRS